MDTQMLIGSVFELGEGSEEKIFNPRTGESILSLPEALLSQLNRAVEAAETALRHIMFAH